MKKIHLYLPLLFLLPLLSGCASVMSTMTNMSYEDAPIVLAYSGDDVIRDQSRVATLIVPASYGVMIDDMPVRDRDGKVSPDLRLAETGNETAYMVDVLPGTYKLTVTYDGLIPGGRSPTARASAGGSVSVSGSYSGPLPVGWIRTSETTHTLKGGEIYVVGLQMMTISGSMDLYPLDESDRQIIIENRNKAQFQVPAVMNGKPD
ncbi:hypothetical protein LJC19_03360 [Oxalobacter sp. OttesenSCG-928-P03]|nr:hypothetical protein [Oxalobacter sp. OttesenSCG-928-P03]